MKDRCSDVSVIYVGFMVLAGIDSRFADIHLGFKIFSLKGV